MQRFGEGWEKKWQEHIIGRLKNWGFNTVANWSDYDVATTSGMPYVIPLQGWETKKRFPFPWNFPDVFSKEFEDNVDAAARRQLTPLKRRSEPDRLVHRQRAAMGAQLRFAGSVAGHAAR